MGHYTFRVEMKDYGSFPSHSIYINITSKVPIQELIRKIRSAAQSLMRFGDDKPYFILPADLLRLKCYCLSDIREKSHGRWPNIFNFRIFQLRLSRQNYFNLIYETLKKTFAMLLQEIRDRLPHPSPAEVVDLTIAFERTLQKLSIGEAIEKMKIYNLLYLVF